EKAVERNAKRPTLAEPAETGRNPAELNRSQSRSRAEIGRNQPKRGKPDETDRNRTEPVEADRSRSVETGGDPAPFRAVRTTAVFVHAGIRHCLRPAGARCMGGIGVNVKPYPMKFVPAFKERVWGGRALERFGWRLPEGPIGEAWVIADHPNGVSQIANGAFAGKGLDEVRETCGTAWFGEKGIGRNGRFPLLVKLLDCNDDLSVQVHPDDGYERLPPGEQGKTEMWYVLDARPGAKIIYGLKPGIGRAELEAAIREGRIMDTLRAVPARPGDTFYIPAGTVHALCAGVLVAEIQQHSD